MLTRYDGKMTPEGPLRWSLSPDAEDALRTMGERGDIIKAMHRAMTEAKLERSPQLYTIHDRGRRPGRRPRRRARPCRRRWRTGATW